MSFLSNAIEHGFMVVLLNFKIGGVAAGTDMSLCCLVYLKLIIPLSFKAYLKLNQLG